mmetsp:Transcript_5506/g.16383  ORF Transcript_5506/g.16383 Transcript_5506/m.16383 type:complete len:123 (-) Transcript_5506:10-378(-)
MWGCHVGLLGIPCLLLTEPPCRLVMAGKWSQLMIPARWELALSNGRQRVFPAWPSNPWLESCAGQHDLAQAQALRPELCEKFASYARRWPSFFCLHSKFMPAMRNCVWSKFCALWVAHAGRL